MKKVLFLHGFTSSGECEIANTLRQELAPRTHVLSPDIPLRPKEALKLIWDILISESIDLVVASSCGAYYALFFANAFDVDYVLINPQRTMVPFLEQRIGRRNYKSPRKDGKDYFVIDNELIDEFASIGEPEVSKEAQRRIFVLLGDEDPLRDSRKEDFLHKEFFHGSHTMNAQQVRQYLAPKCLALLGSEDKIVSEDKERKKNPLVLKTIPLEEYIRQCRNSQYFIRFCMECPNYGKSWACPPLVEEQVEGQMHYKWATLVANHIVPTNAEAPITEASEIMKPTRKITEKILLQAEKVFPGRSLAFAGTCLYCPPGSCTRPLNKPCRHPEWVRPSLEAVGFDITKTASILGVELLWSKNGYVPEYLTLVSGFFHDADPLEVEKFIKLQYENSGTNRV